MNEREERERERERKTDERVFLYRNWILIILSSTALNRFYFMLPLDSFNVLTVFDTLSFRCFFLST